MQFTLESIIVAAAAMLALVTIVILSLKVRRLTLHYNSLTKGIDPKTLMNALQGIQHTLSEHERQLGVTGSELHKLQSDGLVHVQKVMLKRFNPFGDTGGDQSFILALLDGNKDGVVITSLHSRENTRFYVKSINGGVGIDHPLSKEEEQTINRKGK